MEKEISQKLWKYFFIGGFLGPGIVALLNSIGLTLYSLSSTGFSLTSLSSPIVIIFTLPVFLFFGFIPSGLLGICTFFMIEIKEKSHPALLILLGVIYGFISRFGGMFCFAKNKILKDIFLDMFSNKANPSEWIPFLSNVWYTWIFILSGAITCIVLRIIILKNKNLITQSSQTKEQFK